MPSWDEWNKKNNIMSNVNADMSSVGLPTNYVNDMDLSGFGENATFNLTKPQVKGMSGNIGWNTGTLEGVGSVMGGLGSLAQAWAGLQGVKLGKERLAAQDQQFGANFTNSATTMNNQINKHNNWAAANNITNRYDNVGTDYKNIG